MKPHMREVVNVAVDLSAFFVTIKMREATDIRPYESFCWVGVQLAKNIFQCFSDTVVIFLKNAQSAFRTVYKVCRAARVTAHRSRGCTSIFWANMRNKADFNLLQTLDRIDHTEHEQ